ncbi:zinc finger B-box domain-containing protein 1 [Pseudochaenichthys georgianus]|uniref:zinc finger B-box domain-containing protein 1 n=1 Tax=Pseudochaenichthys georgianus TaxID=52239 RepID=UPI0039C32762
MNLNDFVVLPYNKAKSVKLNARNLQVLQMETVSLAHESKEMEEKLQQLKESMSKEKEERGQSGGFRWKSGQSGSLNSNSTKKNKENRLQKLSAGKLKIRVLKHEPPTAPPQPPPLPSPTGLRTTRKSRLRGTHCGQCEVKTAGILSAGKLKIRGAEA